MNEINKKEILKRKFYTNATALEIQNELNLTNAEYNKLLISVKKELGLPSNYKRNPSKFPKYAPGKYYIIKDTQNNTEIITYAPTYDYAYNYILENNLQNDNTIIVDIATDENMKKLIENAYYNENLKWDEIMLKYKLPYNDFYRLLNEVKKEYGLEGTRTSSNQRYIYEYTKKKLWKIRKTMNGKTKDYGDYTDLNIAIKIRDYLESINWNNMIWEQNKEKILEEYT